MSIYPNTMEKPGEKLQHVLPQLKTYFGTSMNALVSSLNKERYEHDSGYDVILVAKDGKEFKSHRKFLGSVSIFFDRMFKAQMKEQYDTKVNIKNINSDIMQIVLDFIYTSSVAIDQSNAVELLAAADYLEMKELAAFCVQYILTILNKTNCMYYYHVGVKHNIIVLVDCVREIVMKCFEEVVDTEGFKSISDIDFLTECLAAFAVNDSAMKAKTLYEAVMGWISYDLENRKQHCLKLLKIVKPRLLSMDFLKDLTNVDVIKELPACEEFINKEIYRKSIKDNHLENSSKNHNKFVGVNGTKIKIFDLFTLKWKDLPDLEEDASGACIVAHKDVIYLIGGSENPQRIQLLQFKNDFCSWKTVGSTIDKRANAKARFYNGTIIICGGSDKYLTNNLKCSSELQKKISGCSCSSVEVCAVDAQSHFIISRVVKSKNYLLFTWKDFLYCLSMYDGNLILQRYSNSDPSWLVEAVGDAQYSSKLLSAACVNGVVYVICSDRYDDFTIMSYSIQFKAWRSDTFSVKKFTVGDCLAIDDNIYLLGRDYLNTFVLKYSAIENSWKTIYEEKTEFAFSALTAI